MQALRKTACRTPGTGFGRNATRRLTIRRVFVDRLSGGDTAVQIRDMIVAAMEGTKLFRDYGKPGTRRRLSARLC